MSQTNSRRTLLLADIYFGFVKQYSSTGHTSENSLHGGWGSGGLAHYAFHFKYLGQTLKRDDPLSRPRLHKPIKETYVTVQSINKSDFKGHCG